MITADGMQGFAWAPGDRPRAVYTFTIVGDRIVEVEVEVDVVADPETIAGLDIDVAAPHA